MSIPTRHPSLSGTHQSTQCPPQPRPRAAAPACLGTLRLCGSTDDQVWECCSLTLTMCAPAAGSVLAAKPQPGSGWPGPCSSWTPKPSAPQSPSVPPALSFTHHTGRKKNPWELEINSTLHSCCTNSRFQAIFLEGEQKQRLLTCVWRKGLEILAAA